MAMVRKCGSIEARKVNVVSHLVGETEQKLSKSENTKMKMPN